MDSTISKLMLAFVTLLVGIVLIGSIASEGLAKTTTINVADEEIAFIPVNSTTINTTETLTVAYPPTSWKIDDCPLTSFSLNNGTDDLTLTTDYVPTLSAGTFTLKDTAEVRTQMPTNVTYASYTYCGDDYMNLTWGRTTINLVPGFFALAILFVSVMLFYSVAKDYNII